MLIWTCAVLNSHPSPSPRCPPSNIRYLCENYKHDNSKNLKDHNQGYLTFSEITENYQSLMSPNNSNVTLLPTDLWTYIITILPILDVVRDVWERKSTADIALYEKYMSTRRIENKSAMTKIKQRTEASIIIPVIEDLITIVRREERESAYLELQRSKRLSLELNKAHVTRLMDLDYFIKHLKRVVAHK